MERTMLRKEIEVYSDTYGVRGVIKIYSMVEKLFFEYRDKEIVMGIQRDMLTDEEYAELGRRLIETYISELAPRNDGRKLQLHYWYIDERNIGDVTHMIGHGIISGHKKISDTTRIHTSPVQSIYVDEDADELVLCTADDVYHCPLAYCRFRKQDRYEDIIPDYTRLKGKYKGTVEYPSIEAGNVLLVLSNFSEYYFHSLYYVPADSEDGEPLDYVGCSNTGIFQDSYLINTDDYEIDIRYFPHFQNIEFYSEDTEGCPFFIENIGDIIIYARTHAGTIKLEPGERKEVTRENAEREKPVLPGGDLYPARICE